MPPKLIFPWTQETLEKLQRQFLGNASFQINWPWGPYHITGFRALRWAAREKMTKENFFRTLTTLSCPGVPRRFAKSFRQHGLTDEEDRIIALDPAISIKQTFLCAGENIEIFSKPDLFLPTIGGLLNLFPDMQLWRPIFTGDQALVEEWMAKDSSLLKSFQNLQPWVQLEVIENLVGVTKPSSILNFERIYESVAKC